MGDGPDVRMEVRRGPGGAVVLADGRMLPDEPGRDPRTTALAAAGRHAARQGRTLRVQLVDAGVPTTMLVAPGGAVTAIPTPPPAASPTRSSTPPPRPTGPSGPTVRAARVSVDDAGSAWHRHPAASSGRRPVGSLVAAAVLAAAVLVGAVGTGVATLAGSQALPDSCRPVTLYGVGGAGGASDVLTAVSTPLSQRFGEKISVVTVPPPTGGGSYASAEAAAVGSLADAIGDHVEGCPTGRLLLFGYSQGAQVAGDLASRIGTGLEPRIPAELVSAVGLFGDPARSPVTRTVPEGTTGQGVLPPRAVGFGSLDARTIQICAPGDPVCDSSAASPSLDQALAAPAHASYETLPIATGTTAPQWAAASLSKVVAVVPSDAGPAAAKAPASTTDPATATTTNAPSEGSAGGAADPTATTSPGRTGGTTAGSTATASPGRAGGTAAGGSAATVAPTSAGPAATVRPEGTGEYPETSARSSSAVPSTDAPTPTPTSPPTSSGRTGAGSTGRSATTTAPAPTSSSSGAGASAEDEERDEDGTTPIREPGATGSTGADAGSAGRETGASWAFTSGLEGFKSTPWNNQNATDPSAAESPNVPGRQAVKFEMPGGGKRTEAEPDIPEFQDGETAFVGYSGFFEQGFPTDTDDWQLIMQFKQPGTGSPPLAVEVGKGQLRLANNGGNQKDFCPVSTGAFSFQLKVTFGGAIDAWCNGTQTLTGYRTPESNVNGSAYLKTGIYRNEGIGQDSVLYLNDLKFGTSLDDVSGLAGAPGGAATADEASTTADEARTTAAPTGSAEPAGGETGGDGGEQVCEKFGSTEIAGGQYMVQNNEWGADDGQCVTATAQGFTVDSGDHSKNDSPAAYPSIMSGCWMGTCTRGTTLPTRISELGPISSGIAGTIPEGATGNFAYDIWADSTPKEDGGNDALELMIWLNERGGIKPIGEQSGTVTIGGAGWDVWKGTNGGVNVISYVRQGYVEAADDLPITDFVQDAVAQGSVPESAFLTNIQAGFEPWTGGPGMALTRFSVDAGGESAPAGATPATSG